MSLENWLAVADNVELTLKWWFSNSILYGKEKLVSMSTKKVYRNVHRSFIDKEKIVSAQMSSRMNNTKEQCCAVQRKKPLRHMEESQMPCAEWEKPVTEVTYVWFTRHLGKGNTLGMENRSLAAGDGAGVFESNGRYRGCILTRQGYRNLCMC